jgi:hypothetical protein
LCPYAWLSVTGVKRHLRSVHPDAPDAKPLPVDPGRHRLKKGAGGAQARPGASPNPSAAHWQVQAAAAGEAEATRASPARQPQAGPQPGGDDSDGHSLALAGSGSVRPGAAREVANDDADMARDSDSE